MQQNKSVLSTKKQYIIIVIYITLNKTCTYLKTKLSKYQNDYALT